MTRDTWDNRRGEGDCRDVEGTATKEGGKTVETGAKGI